MSNLEKIKVNTAIDPTERMPKPLQDYCRKHIKKQVAPIPVQEDIFANSRKWDKRTLEQSIVGSARMELVIFSQRAHDALAAELGDKKLKITPKTPEPGPGFGKAMAKHREKLDKYLDKAVQAFMDELKADKPDDKKIIGKVDGILKDTKPDAIRTNIETVNSAVVTAFNTIEGDAAKAAKAEVDDEKAAIQKQIDKLEDEFYKQSFENDKDRKSAEDKMRREVSVLKRQERDILAYADPAAMSRITKPAVAKLKVAINNYLKALENVVSSLESFVKYAGKHKKDQNISEDAQKTFDTFENRFNSVSAKIQKRRKDDEAVLTTVTKAMEIMDHKKLDATRKKVVAAIPRAGGPTWKISQDIESDFDAFQKARKSIERALKQQK